MDANFDYREEEHIERCITGQCTREELEAFQLRVKTDPGFSEKVELTRKAYKVIESAAYADHIRKITVAVQKDLFRVQKRNARVLLFSGTMAAACIGFILFLAFAPLSLPVNQEEMNVVRSLNKEYEQDSTNSFSLKKKRAFSLFFEAQSFLLDGNTNSAILNLEELSRYKDLRPYFSEAIKWHLVIGYIESGNSARAKEIYRTLDQSSAYEVSLIERWKIWWHLQLA